jgi:hypothetical protein
MANFSKNPTRSTPAGRGQQAGRAGLLGSALAVLLLGGTGAHAGSLYAQWQNGPPQSAKYFPLAVWWQSPLETGHSGIYPTIVKAVAGENFNTMMGLSPWPENFGADYGELAAIKANNLYVIGGYNTPYNENTSAQSVASVLALAKSIGAEANVIGYTAGDEPQCGASTNSMAAVPTVIAGINGYDPTRLVTYNQTAWMWQPPSWINPTCLQQSMTALQATPIGSFDLYPLTDAWLPQVGYVSANEAKSDFQSVPNDTLWMQGVAVQALIHDTAPGQPVWVWHEAGGDNLGFSSANNNFAGGVTAGSTTLINASGWSSFTSTWVGLTVSGGGIPPNTKITGIIDGKHAVLSAAATSTSSSQTITVTGGAGGTLGGTDCVASANLCVVNGNEYRPTLAQTNSEVWMSLISGVNGIEYFCHDGLTASFCLGDAAGGAAAAAVQANLTYVNSQILRFAEVLNAPTVGQCSMQQINYSTGAFSNTASCANGILAISTANAAVPGLAMVKSLNGVTHLFVESDRRSAAGTTFTYKLTGLAGQTAVVVYDSNAKYDPAHSSLGKHFAVGSNGEFSDVVGANGDNYEVKIYKIRPAT